jgi:hypothetical protein
MGRRDNPSIYATADTNTGAWAADTFVGIDRGNRWRVNSIATANRYTSPCQYGSAHGFPSRRYVGRKQPK